MNRKEHVTDSIQKEIINSESDNVEVKSIVLGLIKIFSVKIHQLPSIHALKAYKILITFLENYYKNLQPQDLNQNVTYAVSSALILFFVYIFISFPNSNLIRNSNYRCLNVY